MNATPRIPTILRHAFFILMWTHLTAALAVQAHGDRDVVQASAGEIPEIDIHAL